MILRGRQRGTAAGAGDVSLEPRRVLRYLYAGRLAVSLAVFGSALLVGDLWFLGPAQAEVPGQARVIAMAGLLAAAFFTPLAYWHSHRRPGGLSPAFLLGQAVLDIVLVTGIVHVTGGSESVFPPLLYVALVSAYAVLLPIRLTLLLVAGAGTAYLLDITLAYPELPGTPAFFQVGIFAGVAGAASYIGSRLRETRRELADMESALWKLRLNTIDVLHSLQSAVLTLDDEGRIAYLNPLAEDLLGLPSEHWIGRNALPELQSRAPGLATAFRETVRDGSGIREREVEVEPADGRSSIRGGDGAGVPEDGEGGERTGDDAEPPETIPVAARSAYLARSGGTPTVTLLLQDLRPTRQLERLRRRTERLEAVTELSASLAHEIRNPLASIQSAAQQLSARAGEEDGGSRLTDLIVRESQRLDRLLGEFNEFAAMEITNRQPVELEKVVRNAVEVVREHPDTPEGASFPIRVEGFEDGMEGLWGDEDLLHRAFLNLLLNAVQAWQEGPREEALRVEVVIDEARPEVVPSEIAPGRPVRVRVMDNGPGIDEEDVDRLFDPFFSGREEGTGLGLSVAYRIARVHGGTLSASSPEGGGATFEFVLLRREPEARELLDRAAAGEES